MEHENSSQSQARGTGDPGPRSDSDGRLGFVILAMMSPDLILSLVNTLDPFSFPSHILGRVEPQVPGVDYFVTWINSIFSYDDCTSLHSPTFTPEYAWSLQTQHHTMTPLCDLSIFMFITMNVHTLMIYTHIYIQPSG